MQLVTRRLEITYDDKSEAAVDVSQSMDKCWECIKPVESRGMPVSFPLIAQ
jgi:hypothetical protein